MLPPDPDQTIALPLTQAIHVTKIREARLFVTSTTMTNLTVTLDERIVKLARLRAVQEGTSISAQVRAFLERYAHGQDNGGSTASVTTPIELPIFAGKSGLQTGIDPCSNKSMLTAAE
ncbi:MAG: hypothetical protein Q4D91_06915 [Lautropia sp.]|nr:hypothetical protein [Lautropia sp.]